MDWRRFGTDPTVDESAVGINFVDVLFALVVGFAIEPLALWWRVPAAGWSHLAVAGTMTLTSWIGYHNSKNRPSFVIAFPNLPLAQFLLDVSMVVVYGFAVLTAEGLVRDSSANTVPTALPEAITVVLAFLLYVSWDLVARWIRASSSYRAAWDLELAQKRPGSTLKELPSADDKESKNRRRVTRACLVVALCLFGFTAYVESRHGSPRFAVVCGIDAALVVLLLGFRLAKEYCTPRPSNRPPAPTG